MNNKRLFSTVFIVFTNLLGATIIIPILPLFAVATLGGIVLQVVLLDTAYYAAKFIATPILGRLSDQYGRRPLLLISQAGTIFSFLLFTVALPLGAQIDQLVTLPIINGGLFLLYFARLLDGFTGGNTAIAQAYVTDISSESERTRSLGYLAAAMGIGFILGPAIGGLLASVFSMSAPFIFGTFMAIIGLLLTLFFLPESLPREKRLVQYNAKPISPILDAHRPNITSLFMIGILTTLCFAAISPTFALYANDVLFTDVANTAVVSQRVGIIFMLVGVVIAVTQGGLLKPITTKLGERQALFVSQQILLLSFFLIPFFTNPWAVALLLVPLAFAYSLADPTLQSLISKCGSETAVGQRLGQYQSYLSLAFMLGPIWAGLAFQHISPQSIWLIACIILIPSIILSNYLDKAQPFLLEQQP